MKMGTVLIILGIILAVAGIIINFAGNGRNDASRQTKSTTDATAISGEGSQKNNNTTTYPSS